MKLKMFLSPSFLGRFGQRELARNLATPPRPGTELGECSTARRAFSSPANLRPKPDHDIAGFETLRLRASSASPEYRPSRLSVLRAAIPARFPWMKLAGVKHADDKKRGSSPEILPADDDHDVAADFLVDMVADFMLTYLTAAITSYRATRDVPPPYVPLSAIEHTGTIQTVVDILDSPHSHRRRNAEIQDSPARGSGLDEPLLPLSQTDYLETTDDYFHYGIWRITSFILHVASVFSFVVFFILYIQSGHDHSTSTRFSIIYMAISSIGARFLYRLLISAVHEAQRIGPLIAGLAGLVYSVCFMTALEMSSVWIDAAYILRGASFLALVKTISGVNTGDYYSTFAIHYGTIVILHPGSIAVDLRVFYGGLAFFALLLMYTPDAVRPTELTPLHKFMSFFLGDYLRAPRPVAKTLRQLLVSLGREDLGFENASD